MSFQEEIVRIRLDSKAFEKELAALKNKPEVSELKVKAKLVKTSVTALIRSFETLKASVKVQAKIANLKTLQTSLDAFDGKITVDAIVNFTKAIAQIEKFKTTKAVYIAAKLAPDSITTFQNDVQELTKLVFKTVRLVEFKDVDSDVAAQIQKTIAKVQKGLARKIPVTLETTGKYVAELQSALASLKNTDNIDLFNGAIEQLETIKTKLKAIENHSIDLQEIPAKRVKKDNPNGLDAATVHVQAPHGGQPDAFRVSVAVKPTLDPQSLSAVLDEIESYSPTVQVGVELDPKKVAALSETPLPKLDPVPVSIDPALNETKSTEAIAKLKTNVEAVIAELKTYIANGLSSAVQEGLKRRVSEDAAKLSVDIERVNVDNLATSVSNAVVDGLKEISAADLKQLKQKIGTAKGIATQAEKPEVKPEYVKSVLKQIEKLQAAKALLSGTGNEATEQDLDATLSRLIAALTKLGGSLGEAQFDLDNTEIKNTLNAIEQKVNSSQDPKSAKIPDQPPQTVDLYKNMGMDATPEIQNLVTQIARLVAVNKGLGDVWQDSMAPPVFTQGYHLEPLARGAAFKDGSGLVLRSDVAEFLTGTEGAFKDSFETVVHEIVHVMQRLSKDLGRDIEYDTQPQNERERRSIQITESNPFYQAENKLTGGQTFKNEHMANLTAYRESAQIAHELGIKLYSAIDPAKKLAAKLTAFNTALNNAPKIVQRVTEVQGAVAGAVAQAKAQEMADFQLGTTPDPYRSSSPQKVVKSTAEKLEAVTKSFFELEELFKKADADLKKAKRRDSNATKEDIEKLQRYRDYTEQRKTDVSRLRSELQQKLADDEKYLGNTVIATNRNRQEKTQADINVIATRNQVAKNLGAARVNTEDQRTRTARNRADAVTKVADATVNAKNSKTAQQELDAIQKREIELKLAGLKATKAQLLIDLQALRNTKQDASNQAQIVKDKNAIALQLTRIREAEVKLAQRQLKLNEAVQTSPDRITQSAEKTTQALTKTQMLEEELRQLIAKGAGGNAPSQGGSSGSGGGGRGSTNVAGASGDMPDEDAVALFRARVAQIQAQLVQEAERELSAAQESANTALDRARQFANHFASQDIQFSQNLDIRQKELKAAQASVNLAQRRLALAESSAMSEDKIDRSRLALLQAQQRLAAAELRVTNATLDSQLKAQRLTINEQRIAAGVRREQRELAPRSYGATGGNRSQVNAERRLPINLGLNILEASNNRLGNLARVFIDLQEGIQSASLEGETFAQTFNRIKTPIAIIGIVGAMASLVAITAPAVIAIQKLEKSLTAFGKQNEFADSLKLSKELATEYGASLTTVAAELSRFKTSLADSSIADQSNSIFASLVKYGTTVGASQDELSRGLVALGQIASKGKVSLEELNGQLSEAIVGSSSIAAKALGITKAELFEMAQAGSLLSDDFLPKFRDELERVNKAQEAFGKSTLSQAFGKLKESLIIEGLDKTSGAIDLLTSAFEGLATFVNDGVPVPFNLLGEAGLQLSTILNASVTASFIYLMSKAQPLIRVLKLLQIPFLIAARNTAILTDQTIGLTLAQRRAYISSMSLTTGLKAMVASAAPLIALFAALQIAFGVFNELDGGDLFRETNKEFEETAENIKKLKVTILKNLADIQNAQNKGKPDDQPNPFQNISKAEQKSTLEDFKKLNPFVKLYSKAAVDIQRVTNAFKDDSDPSKIKFKGSLFRGLDKPEYREQDQQDLLAVVDALRQEDVEETLKAAEELNVKLSELVNNRAALDELAANALDLENTNNTISSLGLVVKAFEEGRLAAADLQATLLKIGVPQELIPPELGQGMNDAAQDSRELDNIFASLEARKDVLKQVIDQADPEALRQLIKQFENQRAGVEKGSDNYKELTENINLANIALRKIEKTLARQKVAQDKVTEALITYNSIKAENEGVVDLATTLAEVALKQDALNKGVIFNSSLSLSNMQIKARAHTLRMAQIQAERKALDGLTMNLRFEDAFAIKNVIKDDSLFQDQEDGTFSFAIDKASVTQLDAILLKTEGKLTDSVKKSIEAIRNESSNLNLAYAQQQSGLLDIQLEVREKVAEANKDFAEAMENFGSETKELTKSFIETFAEGILSINREITDLSNDLKKLKITNAGKQFDNALRRFVLNATGDLDESVLENIKLRNEMDMEAALAEIDFQSESARIANSFADGVSEINKAFTDYLAEFKKLQQDLIKARQEQAKAEGDAANITPDLSSFDYTKSQLNQTVGDAIKTNAIPDSKALIKSSELVGKEAKKQTELANKQLAGQAATGASVDSQTLSMQSGHAAIIDMLGMDVDAATVQLAVLIQMRNLLGSAATSPTTPQVTGNTHSLHAAITPSPDVVKALKNTLPGGVGTLPPPPRTTHGLEETSSPVSSSVPVSNASVPFTNTPLGRLEQDVIALRRAIVGKESSGDYTAVNEDTGASGYGQVMPANIPSWTKEALGRSLTQSEFLANPEAQLMTVEFKLNEFLQQELGAGSPLDLAVRRTASIWYSGDADKYNNTRKLGKYPSIDEYTKEVLSRFKTEKANLKSSPVSSTPQASGSNQTAPTTPQATNQKVMDFTEALGIASQLSSYYRENIKALEDKANIESQSLDETKVGTTIDLEAQAIEIAGNNKVTIENAEGIAEAIKPELPKYEKQARENLSKELTKLEGLQGTIAPALKQIDSLDNTLSNLFSLDNPLLKPQNGETKEEAETRVAKAITETLGKIAQIKTDPNFVEIQKLIAKEEKIAETLLKIEEYGLKRADSYNKKAADYKVEQKVEAAKQQLEDPYINPVQKIQLEKNLKLSEQALDFGKKVKEQYDLIMKENPAMAYSDAWAIATARVRNTFEDELANLTASADSVKNKLKESFKDVVVGMFSIDFADTSKTFSEKIFAVFNDVLRNLQTWAAGKIGEVLIAALNKGSSKNKNGKSVDDFSEGLNGVNDLMPFPKKIEDKGDPDRKNKANPWGNIAQSIDSWDFSFGDLRSAPTKGGSGEWMNLAAATASSLGSMAGSQAGSKGGSGAAKLKPWLGLAASAASTFGGGWGQIGASILGAFMADGGEVESGMATDVSSYAGNPRSLVLFNPIANLLETERIKSNGKAPVLTALHMGEHVLSTKNKDAQAFQAMQQNGVWDAVKSASGYASGGSVGLMSSNMRMNQLFKSDNSQTKTINNVSNFNFTATNDQLIQRTEAQIQARKNNYL